MQTNLTNNEKFEIIFSEIKNYTKNKKIRFWEVGTDFILYYKRYIKLIQKIKEDYNSELNENESLILVWEKSHTNSKNTMYCYLKANIRDLDGQIKFEQKYYFKSKTDEIEYFIEGSQALSNAVYRQTFETWVSSGLIFIDDDQKFSVNSNFKAILLPYDVKEDNIDSYILKLIMEVSEISWNLPTLSSYSFRDIIFTFVFTYFLISKKGMDWELLKELMGDNFISFRDKSEIRRERNFNYLFEEWNKPKTNSYKAQTTILKWSAEKKWHDEFSSLLDFIYNKVINNWSVDFDTIQRKMLEREANLIGRNGQQNYRDQLLNSFNRLSAYVDDDGYSVVEFERHDILTGVHNPKLVEAAHIYNHADCSDEEKYDINNGLLLDPAMHRFFDKNIIAFDENGFIYIKKGFEKEVLKILKIKTGQIRAKILNEEVKKYLKMRIEKYKIDFNEFVQIPVA